MTISTHIVKNDNKRVCRNFWRNKTKQTFQVHVPKIYVERPRKTWTLGHPNGSMSIDPIIG